MMINIIITITIKFIITRMMIMLLLIITILINYYFCILGNKKTFSYLWYFISYKVRFIQYLPAQQVIYLFTQLFIFSFIYFLYFDLQGQGPAWSRRTQRQRGQNRKKKKDDIKYEEVRSR